MTNSEESAHFVFSIRWRKALIKLWSQRYMLMMLFPGVTFYLVYRYLPIYGIIIAFQDFSPFKGVFASPWVGLKHFIRFFGEPSFGMLFRNTLVLAVLNMALYFPVTVLIALLLNEVRHIRFKRIVQSITYLPHFLSWVVVAGLTYTMLNTSSGALNLARASALFRGLDKLPRDKVACR